MMKKQRAKSKAKDPLARIADRAVATGIRDLADNHDFYVYGSVVGGKPSFVLHEILKKGGLKKKPVSPSKRKKK